jgi:hypothetical protein
MSANTSAQHAWRRVGAVCGLALLTSILTVAGFFACVLPGAFLWVIWSVAMPALLLEQKTVGRALSRSYELVRKRFWATLGVRLVGTFLGAGVSFALTAVILGLLHAAVHGTAALAIAQGFAGTVTSVLTTPFVAAATIVLYFDLRIRNEGFDIQMALRKMDAARAAAGAAAL